jgi:hypothetical protein
VAELRRGEGAEGVDVPGRLEGGAHPRHEEDGVGASYVDTQVSLDGRGGGRQNNKDITENRISGEGCV